MRATKRFVVSLPDDVAAYLAGVDDASATVAAALRAQRERASTSAAILQALGYRVTGDGPRWREKLRPMNLEQRVRIVRRRRQLLDGADEPGQGTRA